MLTFTIVLSAYCWIHFLYSWQFVVFHVCCTQLISTWESVFYKFNYYKRQNLFFVEVFDAESKCCVVLCAFQVSVICYLDNVTRIPWILGNWYWLHNFFPFLASQEVQEEKTCSQLKMQVNVLQQNLQTLQDELECTKLTNKDLVQSLTQLKVGD